MDKSLAAVEFDVRVTRLERYRDETVPDQHILYLITATIFDSEHQKPAAAATGSVIFSPDGVELDACQGITTNIHGLGIGRRTIAEMLKQSRANGNRFGFDPVWAYAHGCLAVDEEADVFTEIDRTLRSLGFYTDCLLFDDGRRPSYQKDEAYYRMVRRFFPRAGGFDWYARMDELAANNFGFPE